MIRQDGSRGPGRPRAGKGKRERRKVMVSGLLLLALRAAPFPIPHSPFPPQDTTRGKAVYVKWGAGCHGDKGAGVGPAASRMMSRPRDFTAAFSHVRKSARGHIPY